MNPINIRLCKGLWDNFDKCGSEAYLTEPSAMLVRSQPIAACTEGAQHGAGREWESLENCMVLYLKTSFSK